MSDDELQQQIRTPSEPEEGREKDNLWKRTYNFTDEQLVGKNSHIIYSIDNIWKDKKKYISQSYSSWIKISDQIVTGWPFH